MTKVNVMGIGLDGIAGLSEKVREIIAVFSWLQYIKNGLVERASRPFVLGGQDARPTRTVLGSTEKRYIALFT